MKPPAESQAAVPMVVGGRTPIGVPPTRLGRRTLHTQGLRLLSDERLARLASTGDRAAFGMIFDRYHQELLRYCVSILRNAEDAGDALQSTMVRALDALDGDTRDIALRPWLYRIAHNEAITLRRRDRRAAGDSQLALPAGLDGEARAELRVQLTELLDDLRELPERQRGALLLRELAGLDFSEIAVVLETTASSAKQATYDARRALHEVAKGREMDCDRVCAAVSDGDGRALRSRVLRAHLRTCSDCRDFRIAITERESKLAEIAPAGPPAAGLLASVLASAGGGLGGAGLVPGFGVPAALKSLLALSVVAALGGDALRPTERESGSDSGRAVPAAPIEQSSGSTVAALSVHRARYTDPAHRRAAGLRAPNRMPRAGGGGTRSNDTGPPRHAARPPDLVAQVDQPATPGVAPSTPEAPSPGGGPLRQFLSRTAGEHPIQQTVDAVEAQLPSAAEIEGAPPVKLPPPPIHPKRSSAR